MEGAGRANRQCGVVRRAVRRLSGGLRRSGVWSLVIGSLCASAWSQTSPPPIEGSVQSKPESTQELDLTELSPEALMAVDVEVTSVSRRPERNSTAAAAIYVLTQEDLRGTSAENVPEALRMVPGIHVAQITRNRYVVASRGFSEEFANKLLVLQDGRTLYSPLFSGVFWDSQDLVMEDIERIEVVRGPGSTLWGANAVNGIINIITKSAKDTQGLLLKGGYGTEDNGWGQLRYGAEISDEAWIRIYTKHVDRDGFQLDGSAFHDDWRLLRGGFRLDWEPGVADHFTLQGEVYEGRSEEFANEPSLMPPFSIPRKGENDLGGGHVLARWRRQVAPDSHLSIQAYFDRTSRDGYLVDAVRDTVDFELQHRFPVGDLHDVIWGVGYRHTWDEIKESATIRLTPDDRDTHLIGAFIQDTMSFFEGRFQLTLGTKIEHNEYTGFEIQPSARAMWRPAQEHALWLAVSRSVRIPSRTDHDVRAVANGLPPGPMTPPGLVVFNGTDRFDSEVAITFEAGYRVRPAGNLSIDIAGFFVLYDRLRTFEPRPPAVVGMPPNLEIGFDFDNRADGDTHGVELSIEWRPTSSWRLSAAYSYFSIDTESDRSSSDTSSALGRGMTPRHQVNARSFWNVTDYLTLDTSVYFVDRVPAHGVSSYVRWDAQVTWRPCAAASLTVGVRNILDARHREFEGTLNRPASEVERMGYVSLELRF